MALTEQVALIMPHLKIGGAYLFEHVRKGAFVGTYMGQRPTPSGDTEDAMFLEVDAITEDGSGQELLANSFIRDEYGRKMRPKVSKKFIRPSLLRTITSPGQTAAHEIAAQFERVRAEAEAKAAEAGVEPSYPKLSVPTAKALERLAPIEDTPATASKKNLVIAAVGAAAAAAVGAAGYLLGGN